MARTDDAMIAAIMPNTSITDFTPYITPANLLTNKVAAGCGSGLSEEVLTEIETYLAAHFASISDPSSALVKEKFENAENTYQVGTLGAGVLGTMYGQTANLLSCGCLSQLDKMPSQVCFA